MCVFMYVWVCLCVEHESRKVTVRQEAETKRKEGREQKRRARGCKGAKQ